MTTTRLPQPLWLSVFALVLLAAFAAVIVLGQFLPLYVDDILYGIVARRAGYDGWQLNTIYPQCGKLAIAPIPLTQMPGRALSWLLYRLVDNPFMLRGISTVVMLACLGMLYGLTRRLLPALPRLFCAAGIVGFSGLGTLPLVMLLGRPEVPMLLALAWYAMLPLLNVRTPAQAWILAAATWLVSSWFISSHPKAMLYAPLMLLAAFGLRRGYAGAALAAGLLPLLHEALVLWPMRINCPDSDAAQLVWQSHGLRPDLMLQDMAGFVQSALNNLAASVYYVVSLLFTAQELGYRKWPPVTEYGDIHALLNIIVGAVFGLTAALAGMLGVWCGLRRGAWRDVRVRMALCLLAAAGAQAALQTSKQFYNTSLIWGSLLMAGCMAASFLQERHGLRLARLRPLLGHVWLVALLSQCVLLAAYVPYAYALHQHDAEELMIVPGQYAQKKKAAESIAAECGIPLGEEGSHIAVDTYTYLYAKESYQPLRMAYRFHEFDTPEAMLDFLRNWDSSGMLVSCDLLPEALLPLMKREGSLCCLPRTRILHYP